MKPLDNIEQIRCWMDFGHHKPDSSDIKWEIDSGNASSNLLDFCTP